MIEQPYYGPHPTGATFLGTYTHDGFKFDLWLRTVPKGQQVRPDLPSWKYATLEARYGPDKQYDWIMGTVDHASLYTNFTPPPPLAMALLLAVGNNHLPKDTPVAPAYLVGVR